MCRVGGWGGVRGMRYWRRGGVGGLMFGFMFRGVEGEEGVARGAGVGKWGRLER